MDMDSPSLAAQHLPLLSNFWQAQLQNIEQGELDFKNYQLPLARIKKVMKTDEDVKHMMISAEVNFANYKLNLPLGPHSICQGL
jgi:nuclear transcription factor Y gamma